VTQITLINRQLDWLVNDLAQRVSGVTHALVVSGDGMTLAVSDEADEVRADQLAAVASGLSSLTRGAARCLGTEPVNQTIVEMAGGYLFVTSIRDGASLAVFALPTADIGAIGYEMALAVGRIGPLLTPPARSGPDTAART
jgi:uncharacterized protein